MKRLWTLCIASLLLCACGLENRIAEKVVEEVVERSLKNENADADVNLRDGKISIETAEGRVDMAMGGGAKIPESFPGDVWLPDNRRVVMAMELPEGHTLTLHCKDDPAALFDRYRSEAPARGWVQKTAMDMEQQKILSFEKPKDGDTAARTLSVILSTHKDEGGTLLQINVSKPS